MQKYLPAQTRQRKIASYEQITRIITGWTHEEYKKQYAKFKVKTETFNKLTGSHYSPARELYYAYRFADEPSPGLMGIMSTPATRAHHAGSVEYLYNRNAIKAAQMAVKRTWAGLYHATGIAEVKQVYEKLDLPPDDPAFWSPSKVNKWLAAVVKQLREAAKGQAIYDLDGNVIGYKDMDVTAGSP